MALSKQFHDSAIHESMKESTLYWTISRFCRCCPCFGSSVVFAPNDTVGQSKTNIQQLKRLGLTDFELQSFYDVFSQLDDDESGTIDHYEFSDAIGSTTDIIQGDAKLNDALFGTFDLDHGKQSEGLDFSEFVITIWNYATYSETELARFAFFNLCECDRTGTTFLGLNMLPACKRVKSSSKMTLLSVSKQSGTVGISSDVVSFSSSSF